MILGIQFGLTANKAKDPTGCTTALAPFAIFKHEEIKTTYVLAAIKKVKKNIGAWFQRGKLKLHGTWRVPCFLAL